MLSRERSQLWGAERENRSREPPKSQRAPVEKERWVLSSPIRQHVSCLRAARGTGTAGAEAPQQPARLDAHRAPGLGWTGPATPTSPAENQTH